MIHKKIFKISLVVFAWGILAFAMSIVYYWLKDKGFIWDNLPTDGDIWNTRKVIFGVLGGASFILMVATVILIIDKKEK